MTREHHLYLSLHVKSNDLSKRAFFNFNEPDIWQNVDGFNTQIYFFLISETVILPDITILYARENLQKNGIEKGTLLN